MKYLIEHGADVNGKTNKNYSILHYAVRRSSLELVKYLVENGAEITENKCQGDQTVLLEAVIQRNKSIVDYLLQHGAMKAIIDCDRSGRSLLRIACKRAMTL